MNRVEQSLRGFKLNGSYAEKLGLLWMCCGSLSAARFRSRVMKEIRVKKIAGTEACALK